MYMRLPTRWGALNEAAGVEQGAQSSCMRPQKQKKFNCNHYHGKADKMTAMKSTWSVGNLWTTVLKSSALDLIKEMYQWFVS